MDASHLSIYVSSCYYILLTKGCMQLTYHADKHQMRWMEKLDGLVIGWTNDFGREIQQSANEQEYACMHHQMLSANSAQQTSQRFNAYNH